MSNRKRDINSTEKLLNVIRGNIDKMDKDFKKVHISKNSEFLKIPRFNMFYSFWGNKKKYNIGIDISHEFIHLVKVVADSETNPTIVDQKIIKYDSKLDKKSPEFNSLLREAILSICSNPDNCNIWTLVSADNVNIHYIKIPLVPPKQMENTIYWAAKKETSFDEKDYIFDFQVQEEVIEQGIPKNLVMIYSAPRVEIEKTKSLFSNIGITLTGITTPAFAIQNIYRMKWLPLEGTTATLYIGNEFSRINIYRKDKLAMTRGIKTGINSMHEEIIDSFLNKNDGSMLKKDDAKKILLRFGSDLNRSDETDGGFKFENDEIFSIIIPVIERLTRQIERTLEHYNTSTGRERVEKIFMTSIMNLYDPVSKYISDQLGIKVELFNPLQTQTENWLAETISPADRIALIPALGLAFSSNKHTPNIIFTYKEKNNEIRLKKINRGITAAFAASLIVCITSIFYQSMDMFALKKQRICLNKELSICNPSISADGVKKMANDIKRRQDILHQCAKRYFGIAVIGELSSLTPENIRLISLKIIAPTVQAVKEKNDINTKEESASGIIMEGVVSGERNMLDSYLAQYVIALSNSPMLRQISVNKKDIINFKKKEVLKFSMSAKAGMQ